MKWTSWFTKERPCKNVCSVVLCFNWYGVHCLGKACESGNLSAQICFLIFKYTWAVLLVLSSRKQVVHCKWLMWLVSDSQGLLCNLPHPALLQYLSFQALSQQSWSSGWEASWLLAMVCFMEEQKIGCYSSRAVLKMQDAWIQNEGLVYSRSWDFFSDWVSATFTIIRAHLFSWNNCICKATQWTLSLLSCSASTIVFRQNCLISQQCIWPSADMFLHMFLICIPALALLSHIHL